MPDPQWYTNWRARHRSRLSLALHWVGIPMTIAAVGLAAYQLCLWRWDLWWRPAGLLVLGYALQFIGHWHEGNDVGEVILVKRLLGRPYIAIAPRFQQSEPDA